VGEFEVDNARKSKKEKGKRKRKIIRSIIDEESSQSKRGKGISRNSTVVLQLSGLSVKFTPSKNLSVVFTLSFKKAAGHKCTII
jgi:hypothetical protein